MEALGRLFNAQYLMDNTYLNLRDVGGVTFLCYLTGGVGDTYTLTEAKTSGGGSAQVLATITRYHTSTGNASDAWVLHTQAAGSTFATAASADENCAVLEVDAVELSADFDYVKLASTGAGLVVAITRDLIVQRAPANLPAMGA